MEIVKYAYDCPDYVREIFSCFLKENIKMYLVGGAVRDMLMNREPDDFDFVGLTSVDEIIRVLNKNNIAFDDSFIFLGYVVAYYKDNKIDLLTCKSDDIANDVSLRDFTMNSLLYDLEKEEIIDYYGGIKDIENKLIKLVCKDNLNLKLYLRAIRFAMEFGFNIEKESYEYMENNIDSYDEVRVSTVKRELSKMLKYGSHLLKQ